MQMQSRGSSQGKSIRWNPRPPECSGWERDSHVTVLHDNTILILLMRERSHGKAKEPSPSHKYTQSFSLEKQEAARLELPLPHQRPPWEGKAQAKAKGGGSLPTTGAGGANPQSLTGGCTEQGLWRLRSWVQIILPLWASASCTCKYSKWEIAVFASTVRFWERTPQSVWHPAKK